jgi:hypothetical protein
MQEKIIKIHYKGFNWVLEGLSPSQHHQEPVEDFKITLRRVLAFENYNIFSPIRTGCLCWYGWERSGGSSAISSKLPWPQSNQAEFWPFKPFSSSVLLTCVHDWSRSSAYTVLIMLHHYFENKEYNSVKKVIYLSVDYVWISHIEKIKLWLMFIF